MRKKKNKKQINRLILISLIFPIFLPIIATFFLFSKPESNKISNIIPTTVVSNHNGVIVKIVKVIDGDTVETETGQKVRYIGINTPEMKDSRGEVQCFSGQALEKNRELVEGKSVELEKDISETDVYGRLLRYVWIGDRLINEELVREGYAHSATFPPDIKYQERFIQAARLAQSENKGFWGVGCSEF